MQEKSRLSGMAGFPLDPEPRRAHESHPIKETMGQQLNKVEKRRRRASYLKRLKSRAAAGITPKKRPAAARAEAKESEAAKKKVVKKKVVKKKAPAKAVEEAAPVVVEAPAAVVEETPAPVVEVESPVEETPAVVAEVAVDPAETAEA